MAAPGTAYDDPTLGTDPQVGHMDDFIVTAEDNGGVHLNSGIPNRAFQLAATAIGGTSLEGAGQIWYSALTAGYLTPTADFAAFAAATVAAAGEHAEAVHVGVAAGGRDRGRRRRRPCRARSEPARRAWSGSSAPAGSPVAPRRARSRSTTPMRACSRSWQRIDLDAAAASAAAYRPMPDMFVYTFQVADGDPVTLPEQALSGDLHELAALVLRQAERDGPHDSRQLRSFHVETRTSHA